MKIHEYGTVTLTTGNVKVEGWRVEREPDDPSEATDEQLLLGLVIHWAKGRLHVATQDAVLDAFRKQQQKLKLNPVN